MGRYCKYAVGLVCIFYYLNICFVSQVCSSNDSNNENNININNNNNKQLSQQNQNLYQLQKTIHHHQNVSTNNKLDVVATHVSVQSNNNNNSTVPNKDLIVNDWLLGSEDLQTSEGKHHLSYAEGRESTTNSGKSSLARKNNSNNNVSHKTGIKKQNSKSKGGNSLLITNSTNKHQQIYDDDYDNDESSIDENGEESVHAGTIKDPECITKGRYYCTYKEDYPIKLVTEVAKYYKWPLEKLFRDLHAQIMPKLAQDSTGNLVCDSVTRVIRPGWAKNTNDRWLVVINTENYHQYVTEVVCQYGQNSRCNFIPPCYYSSCQQRYNTQKLLVIDPNNPYRGPFLSEFLFPSCCVCYVPSNTDSFHDRYRLSPQTPFQRTYQQEAASNIYPPKYHSLTSDDTFHTHSIISPSAKNLKQIDLSTEDTEMSVRRSGDYHKRANLWTVDKNLANARLETVTTKAKSSIGSNTVLEKSTTVSG